MLTDPQLEDLLFGGERDYVERKSSVSDPDVIRKNICAFANDLPDHRRTGVIFVGVRDDGTCAGLKIDESLLRNFADTRDGNILPLPVMSVDKRTLRGCEMAVIQVEPSANPPVRYRGRTWVRVGPSLRSASVEEEVRLTEKRKWRNLPFDHQPVAGAQIDDLDLDVFQRTYLPGAVDAAVLRENQRGVQEQLASMRLVTPEGVPTIAGVLAVGKDVRHWLPGAYIQFTRYAGLQMTDPIADQKEIDGPFPELLRLLDETINIQIGVSSRIVGHTREIKHPDYPAEALRQLARNAVMHRSYEATNSPIRFYWFADRVEIFNPGGPYGIVNRENFGTTGITDYRNPLVAEALKILGYVQRFGVGIPIARRELEKNENVPPEFTVEAQHVLATVRSHS